MSQRNPRREVWEFLRDCEKEDAYINLKMGKLHERLDHRDRSFATELVNGSVRQRLFLDHIIDRMSDRSIDDQVRSVLRLGIYESLFMDTADHAVVNEYVELAKHVIGRARSSFINAVMRRVVREREQLLDLSSYGLSIRTSHPTWIVDAYRSVVGEEGVEAELLSHNQAPTVHAVSFTALSAEIATPSPITPHGYRLKFPPGDVPEIREGKAFVQDEGSQIVCEVAMATDPDRSKRWMDLCAGPGGKFSYLAHFLDERHLKGNELHPHRAKLIAGRNPSYSISVGEGSEALATDSAFDRILIDAPCTGIGALRRRADARWRRSQDDLKNLITVQQSLLDAGAKNLAPHGLLLYVTCSPHLQETRAQVADFLRRHPDFIVEPITPMHLPEMSRVDLSSAIDEHGFLQLLTARDGTDAMFMAMIRKNHKA